MLKQTILAVALAAVSFGASAHRLPTTHYHDGNRVVLGNTIAPVVETSYDTDRNGRRVRVVETTSCTDVRVDRKNNHMRCVEREVRTERFPEGRFNNGPDRRPDIEDRIDRRVERDNQGRRVIVTTVDKCVDTQYDGRRGAAYCADWDRTVTREIVRRNPRSQSLDLNGDGRTDGWERILYQSFRGSLDN